MNIPLEVLIGYGGTAVTIIGGWFAMKFGLEGVNEKVAESHRKMEALWKWKDEHDREANTMREKFNKDISRLEGGHMVQTEQYKQILQLLEELRDEFKEFREKYKH